MKTALALIAISATSFAFAACGSDSPEGSAAAAESPAAVDAAARKVRVLVFSKTAGFRHASITPGVSALRALGAENRFAVDATEDATAFTPENLGRYDAVVFLYTTGNVLGETQQQAFESYIRKGGGFVGVHAASDTEYEWPFYGQLVGAYFRSHPLSPQLQRARIEVEDRRHPSTRHLASAWSRTDEWYDFRANPRRKVHVLATLDERSYTQGDMGADHPIAWCRNFAGGRSWYTGGGHTDASYKEPAFRRHLLGGIRWAAGVEQGDCRRRSTTA